MLSQKSSLAPPISSAPLLSRKTSNKSFREADADARLRDRGSLPTAQAFGRRRRDARVGLGLKKREWVLIGAVVVLGAFVRLWNLAWPTSVVFDEVHFGGFASKYIRQVFFMDVHPPLAKLLITVGALVGGFDGNFDFKDIGKDYLEPHVPYVVMRLFPAILGLALIPITFLTLLALRMSLATAFLGSLLITFDNALITQSRLILLDSFLVYFTALTIYFWVRFASLDAEGKSFTRQWWQNLTLTGLSLGAVVSCKWVGLFTIALVGLGTLRQLWLLLGNLKVSPRMWAKHFAARALCLIAVPVIFYMFMFQVHFWVLNRSGEGDGFMSSEFQHTLIGHGMEDTYADVGFGSHITIRHVNTQGGYLHSHPHAYESGSKQQQITLYPHRDDNNLWRVTNASQTDGPVSYPWEDLPFETILTGTKIRLEHILTNKRLHSHDIRPPVSEVDFQNEVSGYGFEGFAGDANDDFVVEIVPEIRGKYDKQARHRLRTLRSQFRLRHAMSGCYLFSHKVKLPEWAFEQQEVTCNKNPTWDNSLWYIETNTHSQLSSDAEKVNYVKPGFLSKFLELQAVMWRTNAGLTERHAYDSRPQSWPWMRRGINFWVQDHRQVYLIGNPVVWWLSSLGVALYLLIRGIFALRAQRGYNDLHQPKLAFYDEVCAFLVMGWALHYFPFFLMGRQLFLHHYLPSLWFAVLTLCAVFDYGTSCLRPRTRIQIASIILILAVWSWSYFSPLSYASKWTTSKCEQAKWFKSWDFSCGDFYENLSQYDHSAASSITAGFKDNVGETVGLDSAATTIVEEMPEPIKNVFENPDDPLEEKTIAPVGPANEVPMQESTKAIKLDSPVDKVEDTRNPIGLDAGAPEVTDTAEDDGGWHGGAEDSNQRDEMGTLPGNLPKEPIVKGEADEVETKEIDDDARRLAEAAMRDEQEIV